MIAFLNRTLAFLNRNPIIYRGANFHLVYFGITSAVNTVVTYGMFLYYLHVKGVMLQTGFYTMAIAFIVSDMLGCKVFHVFVVGRKFFKAPLAYLNQTTMYNQGGILGIFLVLLVLIYVEKLNLLLVLDAASFGASIGLVFGRIGCHNYGCCFGRPTDSRFRTIYSNPLSKAVRINPALLNVGLIPIQIYSAAFKLGFFVIFCMILMATDYDGIIFLLYLFGYNLFRYFTERLRINDYNIEKPFPFHKIAIGIIVAVFSYALFYGYLNKALISVTAKKVPFSFVTFVEFFSGDVRLAGSLVLIGSIAFVFYGIHGKTLGKYFG